MSTKKKSFLNKKRQGENIIQINTNEPNKRSKKDNKIQEIPKENKNQIKIDDIKIENKNLVKIISIYEYYSKKLKEDWKGKDISSLKKYCESIEINAESNYYLLTQLIDFDIDSFFRYYSKYQFTLTIKQKKDIQKLIKNYDVFPLIKNNIIKEEINSRRELFIQIINCKCFIIIELLNCFAFILLIFFFEKQLEFINIIRLFL